MHYTILYSTLLYYIRLYYIIFNRSAHSAGPIHLAVVDCLLCIIVCSLPSCRVVLTPRKIHTTCLIPVKPHKRLTTCLIPVKPPKTLTPSLIPTKPHRRQPYEGREHTMMHNRFSTNCQMDRAGGLRLSFKS